jgi:hypothetical protein
LKELETELSHRQSLYWSKSRVGKTHLHLDAVVQRLYFLDMALACAHIDEAEKLFIEITNLGVRKAVRIVKDTEDTPEKTAAFLKNVEMLFSTLKQSFEIETKWYRELLSAKKTS